MLPTDTSSLVEMVSEGLEKYRDAKRFRPRLVEARVKGARSLFEKLRQEEKDFGRAHESGYVKILLVSALFVTISKTF